MAVFAGFIFELPLWFLLTDERFFCEISQWFQRNMSDFNSLKQVGTVLFVLSYLYLEKIVIVYVYQDFLII